MASRSLTRFVVSSVDTELNARVATMRGITLPFTEPRYEMIDPVVRVDGNVAVFTFNLVNYGKPSGSTDETILAR